MCACMCVFVDAYWLGAGRQMKTTGKADGERQERCLLSLSTTTPQLMKINTGSNWNAYTFGHTYTHNLELSYILKCPYFAILKVSNFVFEAYYNRFTSTQGQKTLYFCYKIHCNISSFPDPGHSKLEVALTENFQSMTFSVFY